MNARTRGLSVALIGGAALLTSACNFSIDTGETVTETYDVEDFNAIDIGNAFEATIVVGEEKSVEFEINDELLDRLAVDVDDDRLTIGFDGGLKSTSGPLKVRITTPELIELKADGAASIDIEGLDAAAFDLDADGAADINADGSITDLTIAANGASSIDFDDVSVDRAVVDIDGASNASLNDLGQVSGSVAGASSLDVGDDTQVDVETSAAGSVD